MTPSDSSEPPRPRIYSRPDPVRRSALTNEVLTETLSSDVNVLRQRIRTSAQWFYWVAALSLINSLIYLFKGDVSFLAGLAVSQIADAFAAHLGFFGPYFNLGLDLIIAFFVCGFGYLAAQGSRAALIVGMILYALDGGIYLLFSAYLPALFHAYVLYRMGRGWMARRQLDELVANSPTLQAAMAKKTGEQPPAN